MAQRPAHTLAAGGLGPACACCGNCGTHVKVTLCPGLKKSGRSHEGVGGGVGRGACSGPWWTPPAPPRLSLQLTRALPSPHGSSPCPSPKRLVNSGHVMISCQCCHLAGSKITQRGGEAQCPRPPEGLSAGSAPVPRGWGGISLDVQGAVGPPGPWTRAPLEPAPGGACHAGQRGLAGPAGGCGPEQPVAPFWL